jgi:hypothetical protein
LHPIELLQELVVIYWQRVEMFFPENINKKTNSIQTERVVSGSNSFVV